MPKGQGMAYRLWRVGLCWYALPRPMDGVAG